MGLLRVVLLLFSSYVGVIETIRCVICGIASPLSGLYGGQVAVTKTKGVRKHLATF